MYSIGAFATLIGKSVQTLRLWEKDGILIPAYRSSGGHRMYSEKQLAQVFQHQKPKDRINIGYARVSAKHQKDDLARQEQLLETYLAKQGKPYEVIADIGSGINYTKTGLRQLFLKITSNQVETVFILHKDRLVRFGYELIDEFCRLHQTAITIINHSEEKTSEEELVEDIMNIIHVFSCRLNGRRSHLNKKLIEKLQS